MTLALAAMLAQSPASAGAATPVVVTPVVVTPVVVTPVVVTPVVVTPVVVTPVVVTPVVVTPVVVSPVTTQSHTLHIQGHARAGQRYAVDLHPMTEDEKRMYPGRERFDKTEWYESQFKSAKIVTQPEHVDEWDNGGVDFA